MSKITTGLSARSLASPIGDRGARQSTKRRPQLHDAMRMSVSCEHAMRVRRTRSLEHTDADGLSSCRDEF